MELVILIGIQASGKSTFYRERFADTHLRINLDMLKTRHRETLLVQACLEAKQPFVIDQMNLTPEDRARYIPAARAAGFRVVGYCFQSTIEDCLARNAARPGKTAIPEGGVRAAHRALAQPRREEGFDALYAVRIGAGGAFEVEAMPGA